MKLHDLHNELKKFPSIENVYSLTEGNLLPATWWVRIPGQTTTISSLAKAICDGIQDSIKDKENDYFIDFTTLASEENTFFNTNPNIIDNLQELIEETPGIVTIRFLEGAPPSERARGGDASPIARLLAELAKSNDRVKLYYGCTTPVLPFMESSVKPLKDKFDEAINTDLLRRISSDKNIPEDDLIDYLHKVWDYIIENYEFITGYSFKAGWNHSKIFAINGRTLVQGGANYWDEYKASKTSPHDLSTTSKGGATHAAHVYCNFLWSVISEAENCQVFNNGKFNKIKNAPIYKGSPRKIGDTELLVVNTLGSHELFSPGTLEPFFDLFLNAVYHYLKENSLTILFSDLANEVIKFRDSYCGMTGLAGRYLKRYAIEQASTSVKLNQQKLTMDDISSDIVKEFIPNGLIWPFDLIRSLSFALEKNVQVDIVCSSKEGSNDYGDPADKEQLEELISLFYGGSNKVVYKRVSCEKEPVNHTKMVCIDDELVEIGSENFYPSYHQDFALWVGDKKAVSDFLDNYWASVWREAQVCEKLSGKVKKGTLNPEP